MFLIILLSNLWAQPVLIQAAETSHLEYERHLVDHPGVQSFISHQKSQVASDAKKLLAKLKLAQFSFLNGELEKSQMHFKTITDLEHEAQWSAQERKAIHFSFMRQAQLERDSAAKTSLLKRAILFDATQKVDTDLFPPPMVAEYNAILANLDVKVWPLPQNAENFDKIAINGKVIEGRTSFAKLFPGRVRIDFLSNRFAPSHYVVDPKELSQLKIPLEPLATGSCNQPVFNENLNLDQKYILLDQDCSSPESPASLAPQQLMAVIEPAQKAKTNKTFAFYKSKWFWAGVGVVAAGLSINHYANQREAQPVANGSSRVVPRFSNE